MIRFGTRKIGKIGARIYVRMLMSAVVALIVVSGFEIIGGYFKLRENAEQMQLQQLTALSRDVASELLLVEKGMILSSHSKGILEEGVTPRFKFYCEKLLKNYPAIFDVSAIDSDGNEVVIASRVRVDAPFQRKNRKSEPFFAEAMKGTIQYSDIYYMYDSKPFLSICIPITRFGGQTVGVLHAEVDLLNLQKSVSDIQIGESGYAVIIDQKGYIIAHKSLTTAMARTNVSNFEIVKKAVADKSSHHHAIFDNLAGVKVMATVMTMQKTGWIIGIVQPVNEIFADTYQALFHFTIGVLVVVMLVTVVSYRMSRKIARPIIALEQAVEAINNGNFDTAVDIRTGDEIEDLGVQFNAMAVRLKDLYQNLEEKVDQKSRDIAVLYSFTSAISQSLDIDAVMDASGSELVSSFGLDGFIVYHIQPDGTALLGRQAGSTVCFQPIEALLYRENLLRDVCREKRNIIINPLSSEWGECVNMRSLGLFPVIFRGRVQSVVALFSESADVFAADIVSVIENCTLQLGVVMENARLFKKTEELSQMDPLTGLANRRSMSATFEHEFSRFKRYGGSLSVCMLDIDHFKKVNDTYGHHAGDEVLEQLGDIIRSIVRATDFPARYGGEEFAILYTETNAEQACIAAERLRRKVAETSFKIPDPPYEIPVTISIGVAGVMPDMSSPGDALSLADKALYASKEGGRNRITLYGGDERA